jgi:DNA polymerase-4
MPDVPTTILHVDMDAFYASVEQFEHPELRGLPVIVGGMQGRGVVSAASYEARTFGVHSAMPISVARRLCPQGVFLPVRMAHYTTVSRHIREILLSFTQRLEPLSLDEAFLDLAGCESLHGSGHQIACQIKARIKKETGLTASVGVAPNKFLAKLASDVGKPDGLVVVPADQVQEFLAPLPVGRIWGVGAKAENRLHSLGIHTICQLAAMPERILVEHFGERGRQFALLARGIDERAVVTDREAKSLSTETTFTIDNCDRQSLRTWLLDLVDQLSSRLREHGLRARVLHLKIRSSDFRTRTRSHSLDEPTDRTNDLWKAALSMFDATVVRQVLPVRLLGVGASGLTADRLVQGHLFDQPERARQAALDRAVDGIRQRLGDSAIQRASLLSRLDGQETD